MMSTILHSLTSDSRQLSITRLTRGELRPMDVVTSDLFLSVVTAVNVQGACQYG